MDSSSAETTANGHQPARNPSKKGKLISYAIVGILAFGFWHLLSKHDKEQREKFVKATLEMSVTECKGDGACLANLTARFEQCLPAHYTKVRRGKFRREYILDKPGYEACLKA